MHDLKDYLKQGGSGYHDKTCNEIIINMKGTNDLSFVFYNSSGDVFVDQGNRSYVPLDYTINMSNLLKKFGKEELLKSTLKPLFPLYLEHFFGLS